MKFTFKKNNSLSERKLKFEEFSKKYINLIPVIMEKDPRCKNLGNYNKNILITPEATIANLLILLRKNLELGERESLFLIVENKVNVTNSDLMREVYSKYKDEDGFLYISYNSEETWG